MASFNLSDWALRHRSLVGYLVVVVLVAGVWSYLRLGRSEDPAFTVKTMVVQARWPGATINETLDQLTERLERKLQELPYLDHVRSFTTPGATTLFVTLLDSTPAAQVADLWYQVRKKLADSSPSLPQGVQGPFFNDEFGDTYGILYAFTADGFSQRELRDAVENVRSQLLQVPDVAKIDIVGAQDERIYIEFSVRELAGLGINPATLVQALQAQNAVTPAGVVQTAEEKLLVRVSGSFQSADDLRRINFVANGKLLPLQDIATVRRDYADPPQPLFRSNGQPAIALAIAMREGGDSLALGRNIAAAMYRLTADLPIGIEPQQVANQPKIVALAIDEFMQALWEAVAIVLGVSFLSLGLRAGAVVACSIPLVLAVVFLVMDLTGIALQRVSLGALIIALGLLVDDAMITVEMMINRLELGWERVQAATYAYTSTAFPMLTGTLVTVAGFVPIGFARSGAGEYTFSLFAVVAIALLASWLVAVIFAPLLGVLLLRETPASQHAEPGVLLRGFRQLLIMALRWRFLTILLTLVLFAGAVYGLRYVPQQFFPASDRSELLVDLQLAQNSSIYATTAAADQLDALLAHDPDVLHWSTYIGQGAVRFYLSLNVQLPNNAFAQAVVVTQDLIARERVRARLEQALPAQLPAVISHVYALELGPPVGWPVQYRVSGPDVEQVRKIALSVAQMLGNSPYARTVNYNWIEPARTLRLRVDQDQARLLGLNSQELARILDSVVSGMTITQVRDDIYLVDVVARARAEERVSLATLRTLQLPLPDGGRVPLLQLATIEYGQEYPLVWRRDRLPTVTVQAEVNGTQPATLVQMLAPALAELRALLPPGYQIAVGGAVEDSTRSQDSVAAVVPVMLLLMLTLLMIQLQSVQRLLLVLSVAPLGLIGVVMALLAANRPLGFVAILGVVALIGMIIRNSVILIDQIETDIAHGLDRWTAVVEATSHRCRPILLTAAAAILGMLPIAPTVFWGPMAYAIMGGLAVATVLTLLFLPALYCAWFQIREPQTAPG